MTAPSYIIIFIFYLHFLIVHRDSKLVVGCGDGKLYMFNWREFGLHSDQFPGHPDAINSLLAVTDNVILTGCEDGAIRAVHLYPHRFVGIVFFFFFALCNLIL